MRRFFVFTLVAAALIASASAGVAVAQDGQNATAANESQTNPESEIITQIDNTTRVTDVKWGESTATVTLESTSDEWTDVVITDISPITDAGAHQVDSETVRLRGKETVTVTIGLQKPQNPQLSLSTGEGTALLVGQKPGWNPFKGETATWGAVQLGALSAAGGAVVMFGLIGWQRVAGRHDSAEVVNP